MKGRIAISIAIPVIAVFFGRFVRIVEHVVLEHSKIWEWQTLWMGISWYLVVDIVFAIFGAAFLAGILYGGFFVVVGIYQGIAKWIAWIHGSKGEQKCHHS